MQYAKEILFLLEDSKWKLPFIALLFLIMSILEVIGIGLIAPYAALIVNPNILIEKYAFLSKFGKKHAKSDNYYTKSHFS